MCRNIFDSCRNISNSKLLGAKTLFATHYHELTELEGKIDNVNNYCIAVKEKGDDIIFLGAIDHRRRNAGKFCYLNSITFISASLDNLAQEDNVVAFFFTAIQ